MGRKIGVFSTHFRELDFKKIWLEEIPCKVSVDLSRHFTSDRSAALARFSLNFEIETDFDNEKYRPYFSLHTGFNALSLPPLAVDQSGGKDRRKTGEWAEETHTEPCQSSWHTRGNQETQFFVISINSHENKRQKTDDDDEVAKATREEIKAVVRHQNLSKKPVSRCVCFCIKAVYFVKNTKKDEAAQSMKAGCPPWP